MFQKIEVGKVDIKQDVLELIDYRMLMLVSIYNRYLSCDWGLVDAKRQAANDHVVNGGLSGVMLAEYELMGGIVRIVTVGYGTESCTTTIDLVNK
ncbi:hypothetical protein SAMN05444392_102292 [Seinonella peptonophila]|uniref:Uncharacterized protein n=1 Tax=Seinonella peptonophila TaxID=112248 RepID=A0A1M4VCE0_9BACL|nr:hypothetical protein [Seinonella peptonophila]SHE66642.1 hypothetical protein SAMN05444392_102292 [Seinonella peptonophila]